MRPEYRDEPCRTALTRVRKMSFKWSLNPYMGCVHQCTFCFVRAFEKLADRPSDGRYGTSIRVKTNLVEVLTRELARRSWRREQVVVGTATDPYQPAEGHFRLTRGAIEALGAAGTPFGMITRGPMIVRDIDVLTFASEQAEVGITFSIPTLDPEIWRLTEPGTAPPRQRLRAIRALIDAGIDASVGMAPILPGSDRRPREDGRRRSRRAGRRRDVGLDERALPETRDARTLHRATSRATGPSSLPKYERLYAGRAYVTKDVLEPVRGQVRALAREHGIADRRRRPVAPRPDARRLEDGDQLALAELLTPAGFSDP